jgi:hypothetical protein
MTFFAPIYDFLHSKGGAALLISLLLIGMWNMFRMPAGNTSQKLMRWRVGLQFTAICVILLVLFLRR